MESTAPQQTPAAEVFDVSALGTTQDAEQPVWFEIVSNRDGSPTGVQFQVVGRDSEQYRRLNRRFLNKRFDDMSRTRKMKLTAEQTEAEGLELLGACVLGFRSRLYKRVDGVLVALEPEQFESVINIGGNKLTFTKENLKLVFKTVPEMREQLEDFLADRANFLKGSPTI